MAEKVNSVDFIKALKQRIQDVPVQAMTERCSRVTGQFFMVYEDCDDDPIEVRSSVSRLTKNKTHPHVSRFDTTANWEPLDLGRFVDKPYAIGMVVVENRSGRSYRVQPTKEQREEDARRIIVVGNESLQFRINPNEAWFADCSDVSSLQIRSLFSDSPASARTILFPC
jgi:hypothetical protein